MKRKIIVALSVFFILFLLSGIYIISTIEKATGRADNLLRLHRIEILREHLLIDLKRAQSDLYLKNTRHAQSIDTVVVHVQAMSTALNECFDCHHSEPVANQMEDLRNRIEQYKSALSRVFTLRANKNRLEAEEDTAFKMGTDLISEIDDITTMTNKKLTERTQAALKDISRTKNTLYVLLIAVPLVVLCLSLVFLRGFTNPVHVLLAAARHLKGGELDYRIKGLQDEYGEVAGAFNEMASSLKEHYLRMQWTEQVVVLAELAGGLAHEMKNPMAGIKGSIQVLSDDPSISSRNKDIFLKVIEQIERIEILVKSLLNFAQPPKPSFLYVDVNHVFDTTISLTEKHPLFSSSNSRDITIVRNFDPRLPKTMADPIQLQQVFMNLLLNAADAMPNGGTITTQTRHEEASSSLRITIEDTGSGIAEGVIHKIFLPFFTTKPKGTGLGLAITKRLVEQHGGNIRAANNPVGGASFTIDLPVTSKEMPRQERSSALSFQIRE
jgi:signal transduction histidine kinase